MKEAAERFASSLEYLLEAMKALSETLENIPDFTTQENLAADCLIESSLVS